MIADDFAKVRQTVEDCGWGSGSPAQEALDRIAAVCDERLDAIARLTTLANEAWAGDPAPLGDRIIRMGRLTAMAIRAALGPAYLGGPVPMPGGSVPP